MGDLSSEPSMEEILSSIKRIIAEEGDQPARRARPARAVSAPSISLDEEVLELSDPISAPANRQPDPRPAPASDPVQAAAPMPAAQPIVSSDAAAATRGSLEALSRLLVKPEPGADGTLEGMVREMLRPMLREWLDANLPELVETLVSREIARIAGQSS